MTPTPAHTAVQPLPCPFCGSDGSDIIVGEWLRHKWFVSCKVCDSDGPNGRDRESAIERWNLRASLPVLQGEQPTDIERCATLCDALKAQALREGQDAAAGWLHQAASHMRGLDARTVSVAAGRLPCAGANEKDGLVDPVSAPVEPPGATLYVCCRACDACGHIGINDEHSTGAACLRCDWTGPSPDTDLCPGCGSSGTMTAACPTCGGCYRMLADATLQPSAASAWFSVDERLPPLNTEVLIAFDTSPLPATGQLTMYRGIRQWCWPAENDPVGDESLRAVTHWAFMREVLRTIYVHPDIYESWSAGMYRRGDWVGSSERGAT